MLARRVPISKLMDKYAGESFVEEVEGGKRVYTANELSRTMPHAGNGWFEFLGIFSAVFGLALALLEPRLTKQQRSNKKACIQEGAAGSKLNWLIISLVG